MSCRKLLFLVSVPGLILAGCRGETGRKSEDASAGNTIEVEGILRGGEGERVVLEEMGAREFVPVDTTECDQTGSFRIRFTPESLAFYVLRYGGSGYITLLMKPGETVHFSGDYNDKSSYSVGGSPGSGLLHELSAEHRQVLDSLGEITRKNREWMDAPDYVEKKVELDRKFDSITLGFYRYSQGFIHDHAGSPAILVALYNMYGQGLPVFDPERDFQIYRFVDSSLMSGFSDLEAVRLLHAQVEEAEQMMKGETGTIGLQTGQAAPDFVSSRPDGTPLALSELRGNLVLLCFWAGWSPLSREENRILRMAWEAYGQKGFRILQVSLDDTSDTWEQAIREDRLVWDQVSDLSRWNTPVVDLYGVDKIPANFLIDPDGKIVDSDLFGEQLLEKLHSLLNE